MDTNLAFLLEELKTRSGVIWGNYAGNPNENPTPASTNAPVRISWLIDESSNPPSMWLKKSDGVWASIGTDIASSIAAANQILNATQQVLNDAEAARDATYSAAQSSGVYIYDTKALATAAVAGLADLAIVEVLADESQSGARTRYRKESGSLVFKIALEQFLASGTGAVPRTAQGKMRESVSVLDFIPVAEHAAILAGTSTYDCSADIQDAITASNTVYFPNGTYLFSGITINTHNVTLYGAGESRSVLLMTNAAAAAVTIASTAFTSGINIRNLKIEGNASNLGGISLGTTTIAAARIRIQDVFITGFQNAANGYGIRLNSNQNTDIENLWIQECHFGIYRANGGYSTSTRFSGKGSYFGRNCLHGIYVDGQCDDLYIQDGLVEGCLGVGIAVTANAAYTAGAGRGTRLILDSVYFEENNKDGLSSYNAVQVIGTATGYKQHTLTMNECQFAANPSAPGGTKDVGIDRAYAYFNGCRLMPGNVVPTANCNVRFVSCKFPNAENYLTTLKAMPGNVSAFEFTDAVTGSDPNQMNFVNALTFPATARPVSDPNTLDDYEEGTWTPVLSSDGTPPTIAYTEQLGTYTKIGNLVFLKAKIRGVLSVAGTGTPRITGLPAFPLVDGLDPVAVSYKQLLTGAPTSAHTLTGPLIELAGTAYQTGAGNNFLVVTVTYRTTA